jgi:hypothetical protein
MWLGVGVRTTIDISVSEKSSPGRPRSMTAPLPSFPTSFALWEPANALELVVSDPDIADHFERSSKSSNSSPGFWPTGLCWWPRRSGGVC